MNLLNLLIFCLIFTLITIAFLFVIILKYKNEKDFLQNKMALELEKWKFESEKDIRQDALKKSKAVLSGQISEHFVPFRRDIFPYNAKDSKFLGMPIDFIVFDGLTNGKLEKIIFLEIKTGENAILSSREKQIRDCINAKNVEFKILKVSY